MIVDEVVLRSGVQAWFTGRVPAGDQAERGRDPAGDGNLAHRRPHRPAELARARAYVGSITRTEPTRWHLMRQVHGGDVATVTADTPPGAEVRGVDALVTALEERPLVVQVADCVPVLLAGERTVGAVHAGRDGVRAGVVGAAVARLRELEPDADADPVRAVIGPAIGGCCYEVPAVLRDEVAAVVPGCGAETTWGTPSLDLPTAVSRQLAAAGAQLVERVGGCTRCDPDGRWFSHRADPGSGRQIGMVVRRALPAAPGAAGGAR